MPEPVSAKNKQVDAYLAQVARKTPYAAPICATLRELFLSADARIVETVKWGKPAYEYKGIVGGFAAFKAHVAWGLWKAALLPDPGGLMKTDRSSLFGGGKAKGVADLPDAAGLLKLIRAAVELNEQGVTVPQRAKRPPKPAPKTPPDLAKALKAKPKAAAAWATFSPSCRREYVEWITEAKRDETRAARLKQSVAWIADGKGRNWQYERPKKAKT
jgi:uncharacterized protein YdeI (YjbR/CyaY-like superfamily)